VFSNPTELRRLEQIVHPAVRTHVWAWLDSLAEAQTPNTEPPQVTNQIGSLPAHRPITASSVAVIDAIKLIEAGWPAICDSLWVVTCPPEQQLARLMATRGMSEAEAQRRIAAQPPQSEKVAHATVVIDNSGSPEETRQQVEAAWQAIITSMRP
jgi:dephospho-CoA kinase